MKVTFCTSDYNPSVSAYTEPPPFTQGRHFSCAPVLKHTSEHAVTYQAQDGGECVYDGQLVSNLPKGAYLNVRDRGNLAHVARITGVIRRRIQAVKTAESASMTDSW